MSCVFARVESFPALRSGSLIVGGITGVEATWCITTLSIFTYSLLISQGAYFLQRHDASFNDVHLLKHVDLQRRTHPEDWDSA